MTGSAKSVVFITIEDETGVTNLVIWQKLYERQRRVILAARVMAVHCRIQREGEVTRRSSIDRFIKRACNRWRPRLRLPIATRARR